MNGWFQLCVFVKSGALLPLGQQKNYFDVLYNKSLRSMGIKFLIILLFF